MVSRYLDLVNYRQNLLRFGFSDDDMAGGGQRPARRRPGLHGDAETVARGLRAHLEAGADHVSIQVLGRDPVPAYQALAEALQ